MVSSRGSTSTIDTLSPRNAVAVMDQGETRLALRLRVKRPFRVATRNRSLIAPQKHCRRYLVLCCALLSPRKGLRHIDLRLWLHGVRQVLSVADLLAVYEHDHMRAHCPLVVENVTARARIPLEHRIQHLSHRLAFHCTGRTVDVALDVRGEGDGGHHAVCNSRSF